MQAHSVAALPRRLLPALAVALTLGGCAALDTARIELPDTLAATAPLTLQGTLGSAWGDFELGGLRGRFERQASRLDLFGRVAQDRATVHYTLQPDGLRADCKQLGNTATLGVLELPLKRADLACQFSRDGQALAQRLTLQALHGAAGTRDERRGSFVAEGVTLEIQSLHRLQGAALPMPAPVGYVLHHQGQPVAALDLNDTRPRLWQRAPDPAVAAATLQAALALALLWDPATR